MRSAMPARGEVTPWSSAAKPLPGRGERAAELDTAGTASAPGELDAGGRRVRRARWMRGRRARRASWTSGDGECAGRAGCPGGRRARRAESDAGGAASAPGRTGCRRAAGDATDLVGGAAVVGQRSPKDLAKDTVPEIRVGNSLNLPNTLGKSPHRQGVERVLS